VARGSAALAERYFACYNAVGYQFKNDEKEGVSACFHAAPHWEWLQPAFPRC
jgi:hypothetical protein